ncbi:hypothetical protein H4I96_06561 [Botrytis cinerea]
MLLTILELWIAIDKCAITDLPLLKDYDHEIPTEVFQSLLLCRLHDMERLNRIEGYIEQRNVFSRQKSCPSIFRAYNDAQCFSTRYFFGSVKHQIMLRDIETQAKADRSAKDDELKVLQEKYRKLMELHSQSECEYYEVIDKWGDPQELHMHEWPLPSSIPAKQAVVVELDPPIPLQVWRDATIFLIQDVLGSFCSNELGPRAQYALRDYHGLRNWQVPSIRGRIHLLSEVKPHFGTHRKNRTVESLGESDICLNNGLKFLYFDGENNAFMSKLETSKAFLRNYLIKLPERSKELEKFISRTCARPNGEELNEVIASQPQFLSHMKLNEGKALASIPCVYKLQWMSILRELTSPQIDLNKVETAIIVAQICLQTGPALSGHICRASHIILTDNRFVSRLLEALNKHIARIEENLESGSPYTASILIEASIIARDNLSAKDDEDSLQYLLLDRWHRNTHRTSPIAIGQISNYENYCLDLAIKQYWPGYVPKLGWHASSSAEYWLENSSTTVHYNTLTGRLLVHGSPLLYLPADILARESYGWNFQAKESSKITPYISADKPYQKNSNSLLIRAIKRGKVYDFIPSGIIAGLIPESFINDFVHWYHHDKEEVEFRPIVSPWISSKDNWRLVSEGPKWKLIHDNNDKVVDPSSATAKSICKIFGVLDNVLNQNVVYSPIKNDLSILLPRLRISFFIRNMSDSIESHQFRGIQVDEQQFIGILVGLESKFTLRSSDGSEDRLVLVPNGQIIFEKKDVCTTEPHTYTLTNVTGIEQALSMMNSAAIKSSICLTKEEAFLLEQIAKLAPGRKLYPTNERVMQEVAWNSQLSFISQHGLFYKISKEIVQNISRIGFLYPHQAVPELEIEHADDELVERDLIKSSQLRVDGFGAELFSTTFDKNYKSRDCTQGCGRAMRTIGMAKRARNVRLPLQESPQNDVIARMYQLLSNASDFSAKEEEPTLHEMQYNASWLIDPEGTVGNLWYKTHHSFQNRSGWLDPYAVIMWLAAQTFKPENSNQVNQVLFALAFLPPMSPIEPSSTDAVENITKKKNDAISVFVEKLQEQWPNQHPQEPPASSYIDGRAAMSAISGKWKTWHKNLLFAEYLSRIFDALHTYDVQSQNPSFLSIRSQIMPATSHKAFISMDDMFQINSPSNVPVPDIELEICSQVSSEDSTSHMRLVSILKYLKEEAVSPYEQHYLIELENSLSALKRQSLHYSVSQSKKEVEDALRSYKSASTHFHDLILKSLMLDTDMTIPDSERSTPRWSNTRIQTQQTAMTMMAPPNRDNTVMQLNMGEGKSSVLVPSIALALADSSRLVRFIVTKPQFRQMYQSLIARYGNMVSRRIYQFLIPRDIRLDRDKIQVIQQILRECMEEGGIMLVQPEHLLSFQLMGIECWFNSDDIVARELSMLQEYLDVHSRGIIDESNENLSAKYELVYTIGQQRATEHSPQRWLVVLQVLELVQRLAPYIKSKYPQFYEVYEWNRLAKQICHQGLEGFPIARQPETTRIAVQRGEEQILDRSRHWYPTKTSRLDRWGVIAHVLSQKRWRVNYGVDVNRVPKTRLAVPFRAKDEPALSGTNDSRYVLPTSVKQFDLPEQRHTSALVLSYIVRPENNVFMMPKCMISEGETSSGTDILRSLVQLKPQVRVILDVGAQIIDLTNQEAAQQWLRMVQPDDDLTQAAIYFDENDILSVVDRFGCIELLQFSPFAKQMDKCLIFLDESHTQGTDLRLPQDYRAAVTLGNNLTKDRLVQACMRMRKLAHVNIEAASLQEEQERELFPEAEEERQVEKPPYAEALAHPIHPNLRYFVQHGKIDMHRGGFLHAFSSLANTSTAINANVEELPRNLLVTEDFAQTIKIEWQRNYQSDLFQRPVQWVLTARLEDESKVHLVIISPYEAQGLLEDIKSSATVTLHIYSPHMNETHPFLDNLMLYTIPERKKAKMIPQNLVIQLNLFAGQLYLSSFKKYTQICDTLCLFWNVCESDIALGPDGFIPLGCKIFLTKTRRNNESVDKTHMGKILNGLLLGEEDFS